MHRAETKATAFFTTPGAGPDAHMSGDALRGELKRRRASSGMLGPAKACAAWHPAGPVRILTGCGFKFPSHPVVWLQQKYTAKAQATTLSRHTRLTSRPSAAMRARASAAARSRGMGGGSRPLAGDFFCFFHTSANWSLSNIIGELVALLVDDPAHAITVMGDASCAGLDHVSDSEGVRAPPCGIAPEDGSDGARSAALVVSLAEICFWMQEDTQEDTGMPGATSGERKRPGGVKTWAHVAKVPAHRDNTLPFTALGTMNRRILSNLALVEGGMQVRGNRFLSVEAAYVCLFKFGGAHTNVFDSEGVLGSIPNFRAWSQTLRHYESIPMDFNLARWHGADGIIAKLAGSPTRFGKHVCRALNLGMPISSDYSFQWDTHAALWHELLQAKYEASAAFRNALYQTRFFYLYEADTKCARKTGRKAVWGGCFDKQRIWRGENVTGQLLMGLRNRNGIV